MPRSRNRFKLSQVARLLKSAKLAGAIKAHVTVGDITMDVDLNAATGNEACAPCDAANPWDEIYAKDQKRSS